MTLPGNIKDRFNESFVELNNQSAIRTSSYESGGIVDSQNSTSTLLTNGSTFTGEWVERTGPIMLMAPTADQDFTWYADFSPDGTNIDSTISYTYDASGINPPRRLIIAMQYYRIRITNDSGADMTYLRFQTSIGNYHTLESKLNSTLALDADANVTRSVIAGLDSSSVYRNTRVNEYGALQVVPFLLDASRGFFDPNVITNTKFGRNPDVDTAAAEDIVDGGGIFSGLPVVGTTSETIEVFSSSTNDTSAGTGARTIRLVGLDADGFRQTTDVTMNGTTSVTTTGLTWSTCSTMYVLTSGSGGQNAGIITARWTSTTSVVFHQLPIGQNRSANAAERVPAGYTRVIYGAQCKIAVTGGSSASANIRLLVRDTNTNSSAVFQPRINEDITTNFPYEMPKDSFIVIPELTDMKWHISSVSSNNVIASGAIPYVDFSNNISDQALLAFSNLDGGVSDSLFAAIGLSPINGGSA